MKMPSNCVCCGHLIEQCDCGFDAPNPAPGSPVPLNITELKELDKEKIKVPPSNMAYPSEWPRTDEVVRKSLEEDDSGDVMTEDLLYHARALEKEIEVLKSFRELDKENLTQNYAIARDFAMDNGKLQSQLQVALNPWQSIDTAPKDGTKVLLWWKTNEVIMPSKSVAAIGYWKICQFKDMANTPLGDPFYLWQSDANLGPMSYAPTHWMQLPKDPTALNSISTGSGVEK